MIGFLGGFDTLLFMWVNGINLKFNNLYREIGVWLEDRRRMWLSKSERTENSVALS